MEATFLAAMIGLITSITAQLSKKYFLPPHTVVVILSLVSGIGYAAYLTVWEKEVQESVSTFLMTAYGFSQLVWNWYYKPREESGAIKKR